MHFPDWIPFSPKQPNSPPAFRATPNLYNKYKGYDAPRLLTHY
jgi:hypothetical protein